MIQGDQEGCKKSIPYQNVRSTLSHTYPKNSLSHRFLRGCRFSKYVFIAICLNIFVQILVSMDIYIRRTSGCWRNPSEPVRKCNTVSINHYKVLWQPTMQGDLTGYYPYSGGVSSIESPACEELHNKGAVPIRPSRTSLFPAQCVVVVADRALCGW